MATLSTETLDTEQTERNDAQAAQGLDASFVEAPGVVRDLYSDKVWTLPTESFADAGLAIYKSPRDINKDPNFHYEFCRYGEYGELDEKMAQDFVPVTRKELGLSEFVMPGEANPMDSYYTIDGKDICIKIPRQLADLRYANNKAFCDAALEGVNRGLITDANGTTRDQLDLGGEPAERDIKSRRDKHEPTRDELA